MTQVPEFESTRHDLLRLRAELTRQRESAPTPGIAHALRLADIYVLIALGYTSETAALFPEQGNEDGDGPAFPQLR